LETDRGAVRDATYPLIADYPWFGTGAGTFEYIFPMYKSPGLSPEAYVYAHNDSLELLATQGAVGAAMISAALALVFLKFWRAIKRRRDPVLRGCCSVRSAAVSRS